MTTRDIETSAGGGETAGPVAGSEQRAMASQVIEALDQIVGRSRRTSPLRRAAGGIRRALAGWLERAVSATPPPEGSDLPPRIRFALFSEITPSSKQPGGENHEHRTTLCRGRAELPEANGRAAALLRL